MDPSFQTYRLTDDHDTVRAAVREIAEKAIEPYAKDVDEQPRYPQEAQDALVSSGFHAVHIPEEYEGAGSTRSHCHPDRGSQPGCASSS
ncbi:acyl-CoA dehydrogenase family protein [Fodinicola feengrottensis]|uniref:acyl-CoA dehydrogenase family protein n=1 Tax=Fodinicola feengrottensis TaxID=435914 RepID=UPI0013D6B988|nr:acyl-CoA dehydrogenase family protein [Fodinicola feengrottensis]